ncbi:MAG TPA: FecR domain-containing protein [Polyangia bacterium]|jgi:hypothetical protein
MTAAFFVSLVAGDAVALVDLRTTARSHAPTAASGSAPFSSSNATSNTRSTTGAAVETLTVTQLSPETVLEPMPDRHGRGYLLRAGGARFAVPHDAHQPFVVVAGAVVVEDLGTTFTVQYLAADRLDVSVDSGRVRVRAHGTNAEVAAGDRLEVAVSSPVIAPDEPACASVVASPWRPLAERGRYEEAHRALKKAGPDAGAGVFLHREDGRHGGILVDLRRHERERRDAEELLLPARNQLRKSEAVSIAYCYAICSR